MIGNFKLLRVASIAIALSLVVASEGVAQTPGAVDARTRAALVEAREAVWRAYFQGDSAALVRLLPEKMTAMGEDRATIIRNAKAFKKDGGKYEGITFTGDEFFVNGNTAVVWSRYDVHLKGGDGKPIKMKGKAIEVFALVNGRWINPHWHLDEDK